MISSVLVPIFLAITASHSTDDVRLVADAGADIALVADAHDTVRLLGGVVWADVPPLQDGVIRAQIRMDASRGFSGILFRAEDAENGEIVYLRHHRAGELDAWHYTPRHNAIDAWQIFQGEGFTGRAEFPLETWVDIELSLAGDRAVLRVGDTVLPIFALQRETVSGRIGFWGLRSARDIRAVEVVAGATPELLEFVGGFSLPDESAAHVSGLIAEWRVSAPFGEAQLAGVYSLDRSTLPGVAGTVEARHRGIANLSELATRSSEHDTVLAEAVIHSENDAMMLLRFGFSDRTRIYVNGDLVYVGDASFQSRDFRFLGTVGHFDGVPVRLRAGQNIISAAVTEQQGGWAITAQLGALD
ncbi:hypothetical protein [Glycocaulis sp.]|uniref:hypothetical protein n=1 Tax=Glycocaulis sp. TaxID=1969725 RepID=UPI003D1C18D1